METYRKPSYYPHVLSLNRPSKAPLLTFYVHLGLYEGLLLKDLQVLLSKGFTGLISGVYVHLGLWGSGV